MVYNQWRTSSRISLSIDGILSGIPEVIGEHSYTVQVTDSLGEVAENLLFKQLKILQSLTSPMIGVISAIPMVLGPTMMSMAIL